MFCFFVFNSVAFERGVAWEELTADLKSYPFPLANTWVFMQDGAVLTVIVCDVFLLCFSVSTFAAVVFMFSDQRIPISLLFHSLQFFCMHMSMRSCIITNTDIYLVYFSPSISSSHAPHLSVFSLYSMLLSTRLSVTLSHTHLCLSLPRLVAH